MFIKSCDDATTSSLTPSTPGEIPLYHCYRMIPLGTSWFAMVAFACQAVLDGDFASREDGVPLATPLFIVFAILVRMPVISLAAIDAFVLAGSCEPISICGDIPVQSSKLVEQIHDQTIVIPFPTLRDVPHPSGYCCHVRR